MNEDDYDEEGNNIVPCPICLNKYCRSKDDSKCPQEDDYVAWLDARNSKSKMFFYKLSRYLKKWIKNN